MQSKQNYIELDLQNIHKQNLLQNEVLKLYFCNSDKEQNDEQYSITNKNLQKLQSINQLKKQIKEYEKLKLQNQQKKLVISKKLPVEVFSQTQPISQTYQNHNKSFQYYMNTHTPTPKILGFLDIENIKCSLHSQILDFVAQIDQKNHELAQKKNQFIQQLQIEIQSIYSKSILIIYGSYKHQMQLPCSSINLFLKLGHFPTEKSLQNQIFQNIMTKLDNLYQQNNNQKKYKTHLSPQGKFLYVNYENFQCGIYLFDKEHNGLKIDIQISQYIQNFPVYRYLVLVLKQIIYSCQQKIKSFSITLMVISYLQLQQQFGLKVEDFQLSDGILGELLYRILEFFGLQLDNYNNFILKPYKQENYNFDFKVLNHNMKNNQYTNLYKQFNCLEIKDPINSENVTSEQEMKQIKELFHTCSLIILYKGQDDNSIFESIKNVNYIKNFKKIIKIAFI